MPRQQPMIILHNKSRRAICSQHKRNFLENVMFRCSLVLTRAVIDPIRLSESSRLMKSYQGQKGISLPWAWHRSAPTCFCYINQNKAQKTYFIKTKGPSGLHFKRRDSPSGVHFKRWDSLSGVHSKRKDSPSRVHFNRKDRPFPLSLCPLYLI